MGSVEGTVLLRFLYENYGGFFSTFLPNFFTAGMCIKLAGFGCKGLGSK